MDRERVFKLAAEAGFELLTTEREKYIVEDSTDGGTIEKFAALIEKDVRAKTMEYCAKKCEDTGAYRDELDMALECAAAIRSEIEMPGADVLQESWTASCDTRQPIETAPKDGTNILLHLHPEIVKRCGYQMEICHYEKRPLLGETWTAQNGGFSIDIDCATHWEPLPLR